MGGDTRSFVQVIRTDSRFAMADQGCFGGQHGPRSGGFGFNQTGGRGNEYQGQGNRFNHNFREGRERPFRGGRGQNFQWQQKDLNRQEFNSNTREQQFDLRNNLNQGREQQNRIQEEQRKREVESLERERQAKLQEDLKMKGPAFPEETVQSGVDGPTGGVNMDTRNLGRMDHSGQFGVELHKPEVKYPDTGCNRCGRVGHKSEECKKPVVCPRCGKEGHVQRVCPEIMP